MQKAVLSIMVPKNVHIRRVLMLQEIFKLVEELQPSVGYIIKASKLFVSSHRLVFVRKRTLQTLCTYDQYLRTLLWNDTQGAVP